MLDLSSTLISQFENFRLLLSHPESRIPTGSRLFLLLSGAIGAKFVLSTLWNAIFSSLARQGIPGPRLASFSELWWSWHGLRFNRVHALHAAFQTYGPVVRVGPNRVAFCDHAAVQQIYRTHDFCKGAWYKLFSFGGTENSFNTIDPVRHVQMRRWSAPAFIGENLRDAAAAIGVSVDAFVERIRTDRKAQVEGTFVLPWYQPGSGGFVDLVRFFRRLTVDGVGIAVLGTNFNMIETGDDHQWVKYFGEWLKSKALSNHLPNVLYRLLHYLPVKRLQDILTAEADMCKYAGDVYDDAPEGREGSTHSRYKRWNILSAIKSYRDPNSGESVPKDIVIGESALFLSTGSDTVGITLTYITYVLSSNPTIAANLRAELASNVEEEDKYGVDLLRSLPYLNALIWDVLRVYGPSNSFFERITPPTGAMLAGYHIPGGTFVGSQALSSHRSSIFLNPNVVDPERWVTRTVNGAWINRSDEETLRMLAAVYPFGSGVRACIARPLAEIELLFVTSAIARNFRVELHPTMRLELMEQFDVAALKPKGEHCPVRFDYDPIRQ